MTLMLPILGQSDEGDWRDRALCREVDPEIFFPNKGGPSKDAKLVCGRCGVRVECLADVMSDPAWQDRYGVRGGLSVREREKLRKQRGAA